jgi:hypothetical protein
VILFVQIFIFLAFIFGVLVLLSHLRTPNHPTYTPHALDEIFTENQQQQGLIAKLNKKQYQRTILTGNPNSGIFQFMEHYADSRAKNGSLVVIRTVDNNNTEQPPLRTINLNTDLLEQEHNP